MQHLLHQCWWCGPVQGWCRPAAAAWPQQNFIHTQLYSLQSTQAQRSLPPCQQQQGQLKLTVPQFVLLQYDIQCSVKQIQIPTVQMELERPPAADIVNI